MEEVAFRPEVDCISVPAYRRQASLARGARSAGCGLSFVFRIFVPLWRGSLKDGGG